MRAATKRTLRSIVNGYSFIGINLIGVLIFWTFPLIFNLVISFSEWDFGKGLSGIKIVGFENYIEMWKDEWFLVSLKNNIVFTVLFVVILLVVSFVTAILLKDYVFGKKTIQLGLYLPYIINIVAVSAVWMAMLSRFGPISKVLELIGVEKPPILIADIRYALITLVIITVWTNVGYTAILFMAGLVNIPEELYESAHMDGANAWDRIINITIPLLTPTTFFIVITSIINSFKVFGLINILTNGGPGNSTTMLVYNIYRTAFRFYKMGFAASQGIVLLIIIFIVTMIQFRYQKKFEM